MPTGLRQYSEGSFVTKVHCSEVTIHHLHCDIHTQLLDAVVPPIQPFLQQLLLLQVDAGRASARSVPWVLPDQ